MDLLKIKRDLTNRHCFFRLDLCNENNNIVVHGIPNDVFFDWYFLNKVRGMFCKILAKDEKLIVVPNPFYFNAGNINYLNSKDIDYLYDNTKLTLFLNKNPETDVFCASIVENNDVEDFVFSEKKYIINIREEFFIPENKPGLSVINLIDNSALNFFAKEKKDVVIYIKDHPNGRTLICKEFPDLFKGKIFAGIGQANIQGAEIFFNHLLNTNNQEYNFFPRIKLPE